RRRTHKLSVGIAPAIALTFLWVTILIDITVFRRVLFRLSITSGLQLSSVEGSATIHQPEWRSLLEQASTHPSVRQIQTDTSGRFLPSRCVVLPGSGSLWSNLPIALEAHERWPVE